LVHTPVLSRCNLATLSNPYHAQYS
jgi:hypothetical protein